MESSSENPATLQGYRLKSIPLWRKYLGIFDVLFLWFELIAEWYSRKNSAELSPYDPSSSVPETSLMEEASEGGYASSTAFQASTTSSRDNLRHRAEPIAISPSIEEKKIQLPRPQLHPLDVAAASPTPNLVYASSPIHFLHALFAMYQHQSQLVWFRRLYIFFSRYMYYNTLEKM